jgi:hypothetical protein
MRKPIKNLLRGGPYEEKIKISTSKVYHTWGGAIRVAKRGN